MEGRQLALVDAEGRTFSGLHEPQVGVSLPAELRCPKDNGSPGTNLLSKSTFLLKLKTHIFPTPILAHPNLRLPLLHQDLSHPTYQVHGHRTNITAKIIKLSHQQPTWTPLAISSDYGCYYTA